MITLKSVTDIVRDYFVLTLACVFFAMSWACFMIPNGMSAGGFMGLSTVVQFATNGVIQAQYLYLAINVILIVLAVFAMGIGFGFKTIYCILMASLLTGMMQDWTALHCVEGSFFYVRDTVLIPVIAGALEALGIGLTLRYGGSTGGSDIVAVMVNKYWSVSLSTVFLFLDLTVVSMLLLLPDKSFTDMIYGIEEIIVFSLMIDTVVGGRKGSYQLIVFSDKYKEIADHIVYNMDRGVTLVHSMGWYTKKEKDVLLILISRNQLSSLSKVIKEIDPRAFMSVSPTSYVYGEGFEEIKAGLGRKKSHKNAA